MEFVIPLALLAGVLLFGADLFGSGDDDDDNDQEGYPFGATNDDDTIVGTEDGERIWGLSGDDTISGLGGDDTITGDPGNDLISGGAGNDTVNGSNGNDMLIGPGVQAAADGLDGMTLAQLIGDAAAQNGAVAAFLAQTGPSDAGDDILHGGKDDDLIADSAGRDMLYGDLGNDRLVAVDAGPDGNYDELYGGPGDDILTGDETDILSGDAGTDSFVIAAHEGGTGHTLIRDWKAGETIDIFVENAADTAQLALDVHQDGAHLSLDGRMLALIKGVQSADQVTALASAITLINNGSGVTMATPEITLSIGDDVYQGGPQGEIIHALGGDDTVFGAGGDDQLLMAGGRDMATGDAGDDLIVGGPQEDVLNGGAGDDVIQGGADNDILTRNIGFFRAHAGHLDLPDSIDIAAVEQIMTRSGSSDAGDDEITGGTGKDLISDEYGNNTLSGSAGDDIVSGVDAYASADTGIDVIDGGVGDDLLLGDNGDRMSGGDGSDAFSVRAWDDTRAPVEIMDFAADEAIELVVDTPATAMLDFARSGTDVTISVNGAAVALAHGIDSDALYAALQSAVTLRAA